MTRMIDKDYLLLHTRKVRFFGIGPDDESWGYAVPVEVIENAPTLTPPNEWVSVEERLPEYNPGTGAKSYWVAKKDSAGNWQMKIAQYCDYGYAMTVDAETEVTWRDWDFTKIVNVTHWMPLPAPPGKDNNVPAKAPNEPLTLEQLREMDGEPVWVVPIGKCKWATRQWCVLAADEVLIPGVDHWWWSFEDYGESWIAYRRPPEGEEDA